MSKQNSSVVPYTLLSFHCEPMELYIHIHDPDTDNYCSGELESLQQGVGTRPPLLALFTAEIIISHSTTSQHTTSVFSLLILSCKLSSDIHLIGTLPWWLCR